MLNDVSKLCPLLKKYGLLTLVDSVSAMFGEEMRVDDYQIDLLCGGSQKAVSRTSRIKFCDDQCGCLQGDAFAENTGRVLLCEHPGV